ncbi:hypothetical protein [Sphingomonas sp. ID0503]|uniref:hypothetical protein n=1 Tax=Sphingomonas sp. ID0503 TaxID=3399691 RepID=UPI003AFA43E7
MYSESDIDSAVEAGALTPAAAQAFRDHVASGRATPMVDEESFRLLTGFNDIFVSIATILFLVAVAWIGSVIANGAFYGDSQGATQLVFAGTLLFGGAGVAVASWLLASYFTARRRMALPSILLMLTFVGGVTALVFGLAALFLDNPSDRVMGLVSASAGVAAALAALAHWRQYRVPITVAALTVAVVGVAVGLLTAAVPSAVAGLRWLLLIAGLGIFAFAMRWDMSDRERQTRRSDVAFWLHLAAAPMIAHPVFWTLGVTSGDLGGGVAVMVIALYVFFGLVALAIDRRALLVSSLAYVLYALSSLFERFGAVGLNVALTALLIGSGLLMLSAFWTSLRRVVVGRLPADLQARLPALDRPLVVRPA